MRYRWLMVTGLSVTVAGCALITDPDEQLDSFVYTAESHGQTLTPGVDAEGFRGQIQLIGYLNTPTPCHELKGRIETRGSQVTLHVTARSTGSPECLTILGAFRYQAGIQGLRAGTWELRVLHEFPDANWQTQELKVNVEVR